MHAFPCRFGAALILSAIACLPVHAQTGFDLTQHTELSTAAGPILPSLGQFVVAQDGGGFVVSYYWRRPAQVVRYDSSGTMLKLYDLAGQGPGEFRYSPLIFAGRRDTLYAFEEDRLVRLNAQLEMGVRAACSRNVASTKR
jgi:hypothetical protein